MTWPMTGGITEECNEIIKDKNDDVVMYYWTELRPCHEVLSLILTLLSVQFKPGVLISSSVFELRMTKSLFFLWCK